MMKKRRDYDDDIAYSKEDIDLTNFTDVSVHFDYENSFDIYFDSIEQSVYFDIDDLLGIWNKIADALKNSINKVVTDNEFKIKKYQIVDDTAVIVMIFKP